MSSSKKESHSVKKDLSSSSKQDKEKSDSTTHQFSQQIPDGLRLRNRSIRRAGDTNQQIIDRRNRMKKGHMDVHIDSSENLESSSFANDYFNDDEDEDLVIIDSDDEEEDGQGTNKMRKKRKKKKRGKEKVEHVTRFSKSEKSELIEFIYGSGNQEKNSSKFSYHNESVQNEESDENMDETSSLNPIIPDQNLPQVKTKRPNKVSSQFCDRTLFQSCILKERRASNSSEDEEEGTRFWFKTEDSDLEDAIDDPSEHESSFTICIQVFIPFLIAGFGTVGAGLVLDVVQVSC